jgi:hypothetical protein
MKCNVARIIYSKHLFYFFGCFILCVCKKGKDQRNSKLQTPKKHTPVLNGQCNSHPRKTKLQRQESRSKKPKKESQEGETQKERQRLKRTP